MNVTRRDILQRATALAGSLVLMPSVSACGGLGRKHAATTQVPETSATRLPLTIPNGWDPIAYNRTRGNAGYIPPSYLPEINGPRGVWEHIGKHLPYVVTLEGHEVPAGFLALMWGDPAKGYAQHPNARRAESNGYEGHWYNWIRIRKATEARAQELQSSYSEWPATIDGDNGAYTTVKGGRVEDNAGRDTVYLVALPSDVRVGDLVRVHAHCLTHGEFVDFVRVE